MTKFNFKNLFLLTFLITFIISGITAAYNEAPILQERVEKGELPSVEERLPEEPLVMEPLNEIGKYGGTWNRFSTDETWGWDRQLMYGWSPIRWIDDTQNMAPNLLTEWEHNEDKSVWTLHFREGIRWSDGELLTVEDFLFWWEDMAKNPEHPSSIPDFAKSGGEVMEVNVIDDYTVELNYKAPNPLLPSRLANWVNGGQWYFFVAPKHYLKEFHPEYNEEYTNYEEIEEKAEWTNNLDFPVLTEWMPVESESGDRLVLERNPYYYAVDTEGNQLPYIDKINIQYMSDPEVFKLKVMNGEADMQIIPNVMTVRDIQSLKRKEEENDFEVLTWDSGAGAGPSYTLNYNHPEPEKRDLYRKPEFIRALSHAIDRDKIARMIFYNTTYNTTGTMSPKAIEFHRTEEGQKIFEEWRDLAVEYDPEKSENYLDEIGVVDENGDGWRQLPNGEELTLRIDLGSEFPDRSVDGSEMVKENWEEIGLRTIINSTDGSQLGVMQQNAEFDIRNWPGGVPDGANLLVYPQWIAPIGMGDQRWAPLYGTYFSVKGTSQEETIDWDKDPRDRTPPLDKPDDDDPQTQLYELYQKAITTPDDLERDKIVHEMIKLHMEYGPFFIGTCANYPSPGVVKNHMKNVPRSEDLPTGGYFDGWAVPTPAPYNPAQFYFDE